MSDKLDFSLPQKKASVPAVFIVIIILLVLSLGVNLFSLVKGLLPAGGSALSAAAQKELAMKLQKNNLPAAAAAAWQEYLSSAGLPAKDRAGIWYTIGKIYQDSGDYASALESYYRSEAIFPREDLANEISRRVQDSLEYMGKFAALRQELADRVSLDGEEPSEVLAEIGPEKITRADLDNKIEQYIDFQLSGYASYMDQETLAKQKEEMFKYYATPQGQQEILSAYVAEEVLYRKAREEQLAEDPVTRALLRQNERQVLARQLVNKMKGSRINITEKDLEAYYETRKGDYIEDGRQQSLEEVKGKLYTQLIREKEKEVEQQLINELISEYDVVFHTAEGGENESETESE